MTQAVIDNILAVSYLILWVLTFIWYQYKDKSVDAGSTIIIAYIIYAVFSILSISDPIFSIAYNPLKLFPYIYLYVMLMIALSPSIYTHLNPAKSIENPHTRILVFISIIIIICSVLLIPDVISNFNGGFLKLFSDTNAGNDAYMEQLEEAEDSGSKISNLPAIIYNTLSDITVFLCFYFMTLKKKNLWIIAALFFSIIIGIMIPVLHGQRGGTITYMLTAIGGYMLFKRYLSKKINHLISIIGIVLVISIALPVAAITLSRFGKESVGVNGFINWYVGQGSLYFNNYGLDAGGSRHGDRTCNMFKRLVDPNTPKNYVERRDKYHNLNLDDNFFSTFVGDFTIDFNPVIAVVIFIVFNILVLTQIKPRDGTIRLHQMLLLYFSVCISLQGGMTLFSYSDSGNLRIVTLFLLYIYLRYHEAFLTKFPLEEKETNH